MLRNMLCCMNLPPAEKRVVTTKPIPPAPDIPQVVDRTRGADSASPKEKAHGIYRRRSSWLYGPYFGKYPC